MLKTATRREFLSAGIPPLAMRFGAKPRRLPNIVLVMADDQGWGDTGYNGHRVLKTPHLDDMARHGIRFDRFYSGAPVCSPTRGSCLTGRHPFRYGIFFANAGNEGDPSRYTLPLEEVTLAEVVKGLSYRTGHFGKWHLGDFEGPKKSSPSDAGFDEWFSTARKVPTVDPPATEYWANGRPVAGRLAGDDSKIVMDRVAGFIEQAVGARQPFLAVVWMHSPHLPVLATAEHRSLYAAYGLKQQHYWGSITALDEQVGRLRATLRRLRVAEDTMLWYASDNGPEGDAEGPEWPGTAGPWRGRKTSLFEGGIRVPGLLEWPAVIRQPRAVNSVCSTSDYFPTVLDALGAQAPDRRPMDGVSLLPLIRGADWQRSSPLAFETTGITRGSPRLALIENRWKLLTNLNGDADLLFDLAADPGETKNLAATQGEQCRRMRAALSAWRVSCQRSNAGQDYGPGR